MAHGTHTNLVEVLEPAEPEGLHGVRHPRLHVPHHLHQPGDAHPEDLADARRPRRLGQVHLARVLSTTVIAQHVRRSHVTHLREDEVLQGGLLVAPPGVIFFSRDTGVCPMIENRGYRV